MKLQLLFTLLLAAPAAAHDFTAGSLAIGHPFAVETAATAATGAGYLTITNSGAAPDRLVAIRAGFPRVAIHATERNADGVARMLEVDAIDLPPGETVALAPGGIHVMFMGLDGDPFEVGERFPATLVFETAGEVAVEFVVEPRSAADAAAHDTHGKAAP
jgi:copper(I)-binding protein